MEARFDEKAGNITHDDTEEGVKDMITKKLILDTDKIMYERDKLMYERDKLVQDAEKREEKISLKIARNMLNSGISVEQIQNLTELPLSKIKGLRIKK